MTHTKCLINRFLYQALVAEQESKDSGGASIAEQVLSIMEIILDEANAEISEDKVRVKPLHSQISIGFEQ